MYDESNNFISVAIINLERNEKMKGNIMSIRIEKNIMKMLYFIITILLTIVFTIYYYGIQIGFIPDAEALYPIIGIHDGWYKVSDIYSLVCKIAYDFGGLSSFSIRLVHCIFFSVISFFTFDTCIRDNDWIVKVYNIPLYMLFMVQMNLGSTELYGYSTFINQYPFDQHMVTTMFVVISVWLLYRYEKMRNCVEKKWIMIILFFFFVAGIYMSDSLYLIAFIIPFVISFVLSKKIKEKHILIISLFSLGCVGLIKILATRISLFGRFIIRETDQYSLFYGVCNFIKPDKLLDNIIGYISNITALYNFDFWGLSVVYIQIISWIFRGILVICIFCIVILSIRKLILEKKWDMITCTMSIAYVILFIIALFTENGGNHNVKYYVILIPYGTILLSLNLGDFLSNKKLNLFSDKKVIFLLCILGLIASHDSRYGDIDETDYWNVQNKKIIEIVQKENLSRGAAKLFLAPSLYVMSDGKIPVDVIDWENGHFVECKEYYNGEKYDFIVNDTTRKTYNYFDTTFNSIVEQYGEPDKIYQLQNYAIYIYYDGIVIE